MRLTVAAVVFVVIVLGLLWSSAYVVQEIEQVIITQFGKPIGEPVTDAGLHLKVPLIQKGQGSSMP